MWDTITIIAKMGGTRERRNREQRCSHWHQCHVSPITTQRNRSSPQAQRSKPTVLREGHRAQCHSGLSKLQKNRPFLLFPPWEHHTINRGFFDAESHWIYCECIKGGIIAGLCWVIPKRILPVLCSSSVLNGNGSFFCYKGFSIR